MFAAGSSRRRLSQIEVSLVSALAVLGTLSAFQFVTFWLFPRLTIRLSLWSTIALCAMLTFGLSWLLLRLSPEEDLQELEEDKTNFANLVEFMPGVTCIVDGHNRFVAWNSRFQETLGYSESELSCVSATKTLSEEFRTEVPRRLGAAIIAGHAGMEAAWMTRDGVRIPCFLTGVRIAVHGKPCVLSIGIDLTDQKRVEDDLRKSELQYRRLLSNLPDVAWTMDSQLRIKYVSSNIADILGYAPEEVLGGNREVRIGRIHPEDVPTMEKSFRGLFCKGDLYDVEYRMRHKDGCWIWVRSRSLRTYEEDGIVCADGLLTDITARKQAEAINSRLAAIVNSSADAIIGHNPDGTITSWNQAAERMFGYNAADIIGRPVSMLAAEDRSQEVSEVLDQLRQGEPIGQFDSVCARKDGSHVDVSLSISPIFDKEGNILGISTIAHDMTRRRRNEDALRRSQADLIRAKEVAEDANRAKTTFLAHVSDKLRTPVNEISGWAETILDTPLTPVQREYVLNLQGKTQGLIGIADQLLEITQSETGELVIEAVPFNLRELLRQTLAPFLAQARQVELQMTWEIDSAVPEYLLGDSKRLRQLVVHLLENAIKFTYEGSIRVAVECTSCTDKMIELEFRVSDTGIGVPSRRFVVEPESGGAADRSQNDLGLVLCARIAECMGGKIRCHSELGRGTTFFLTLPFRPVADDALAT